jgi:hypothetical protein
MIELNEETKSAISEIGNLCIAGGSNKISEFSNDLVDISVVEAEISSTEEIILQVDPFDTCKYFVVVPLDGDLSGTFLFKISDEILAKSLEKFPKLKAQNTNLEEALVLLVDNFQEGFCLGMSSMTGLELSAVSKPTVLKSQMDLSTLPDRVLCYKSMITVGDERIDFDVFFFADAEILIPKVLESLGI